MTDPIDRLCVEQMADALIYIDRHGVIRQWNAAAEALFGHRRGQAIGRHVDLIIPENLRAAHAAGFERAMERGAGRLNGQAAMTKALTADGGVIYVEMSFAVVCGGDGKALGSVAIARDASRRRQQERELRELRERLEGGAG